MNTNYSLSNNFLSKYDPGGYTTGQFNYVSGNYTKNENTDITIITDDGDRVTISSGKSMESAYTSYSGLLRSGSSSVSLEGYGYQSQLRNNFSMSIVGDLDNEEYEDIISALETVDFYMKSASPDNMKAVAEKFGGLDSLSSLSASLRVEETMSYEQVQSVISESDQGATEEPKELKNLDKLDHALERILNSGKNHGKAYGRIKQLMNGHLSEILDSFSKKSEKNEYSREAGELMKDMIMNRLVEKSNEDEDIVENTPVEPAESSKIYD